MEHSGTRAADLMKAVEVLERQKRENMALAADPPRILPDILGEVASWRFRRAVLIAFFFVLAVVVSQCARPDWHNLPSSRKIQDRPAVGLSTTALLVPAARTDTCGPVLAVVSRDC